MDAKLAVDLSRQWRTGAPASTLKAAGVLLHVIDGGMGGIFHNGFANSSTGLPPPPEFLWERLERSVEEALSVSVVSRAYPHVYHPTNHESLRLGGFGSLPGVVLDASHFPDAAGTGEHEEWSKAPRWGKETPAPGENHTSCAYRRERRDWRNVYLHKAMAKPAMAKLPLLAIEDMLAPRWDAHFQNYRPKMDCVHWCNRPSVWEPVLMQLQRAVVGAVVALPSKCDAPLVK